jgi:hypothetical protein
MLQLEADLHSASFREIIMLSDMKIAFAALILLAGVVAVSAESREVIQNERGTFIQDQSGAWHQYKRMRREVAPLPVFAQAPGAPRAFGYNDSITAIGSMASGGGNLVPLW